MQYLRIKKGNRARADGSQWAEALIIYKTCKFGTVIGEKSLSVKRPVLITWSLRRRQDPVARTPAPSLRAVMLHPEPQAFRLGSDVAYDVTPIAMWILIAAAIGMGAWELAAVLGGLKLLGSGRRAARQT